MSVEHLSQIIGRVVIDTRLRALFHGDLDEAWEGYDLTDHETQVLMAADGSVIRTGISIAGFRYRQIEQSCDKDDWSA